MAVGIFPIDLEFGLKNASIDPRRFEPTPSSRSLRAFLASRSRYAEDELSLAIRNRSDGLRVGGHAHIMNARV